MIQDCKDLLDRGTNRPQSILMIAIRDVEWMHIVSLCIFFGWVFPDRDREGEPTSGHRPIPPKHTQLYGPCRTFPTRKPDIGSIRARYGSNVHRS